MDVSLGGLRVLQAIAEQGSFTAAAVELGYTQSAVSRQVAVLERETGTAVFTRHADGARLTDAGTVMLRHARVVLAELAAAQREITGASDVPLQLGVFMSAGAVLLPRAMTNLRRSRPDIAVSSREGTTPALVRAVRAGTLDLAVVTARPPYRPPDDTLPRLSTETVGESELAVAVPADSRFAGRDAVGVAELADAVWIASPGTSSEPVLGVWPGLPGLPRIAHSARDWLTKLQLVAAGCGVTTVPGNLLSVLPAGVEVVRVADAPVERRRLLVVRRPGRPSPEVVAMTDALRRSAAPQS